MTTEYVFKEDIDCFNLEDYILAKGFCSSPKNLGGAAVFIKSSLPYNNFKTCNHISLDCDFESKLKYNSQNLFILGLYRAPTGNLITYFDHLKVLFNKKF